MTIVAWDGKIIASDKLCSTIDLNRTVTKIWKITDDLIISITGSLGQGLILRDWYVGGAIPEKWPKFQETDDWTRLIVVDHGNVGIYEQYPEKLINEDPFDAWGSGRDYAIGAMAAGCNAIEAVKIANQFNIYCGNGIDWFSIANPLDIN